MQNSWLLAELKTLLKIAQPRIAFCQKELLEVHEKIVEELDLNTEVICFDEGRRSLASFIEKYDDKDDQEEFLPTIFDRNKINMWLISTGGTSGVIKLAAFTHTVFLRKLELLGKLFSTNSQHFTERKGENKMGINLSPVQWVSGTFNAISMPLLQQTKLQTSNPPTTDHVIDMINKYKLVDPETGKEITEPNVPGEMWTKGASMSVSSTCILRPLKACDTLEYWHLLLL
ncbi:hypothetical protein HF086_012189 [Spodoptera exigua]|uniref:Uncharacterized protein n=1 Tax=Spodoptera exigua TaxID=7107 RepID=A0A922M7L0_SPOEX|nr:hypothetical protein HF086_012189 [Spodoptera exigua]